MFGILNTTNNTWLEDGRGYFSRPTAEEARAALEFHRRTSPLTSTGWEVRPLPEILVPVALHAASIDRTLQ